MPTSIEADGCPRKSHKRYMLPPGFEPGSPPFSKLSPERLLVVVQVNSEVYYLIELKLPTS